MTVYATIGAKALYLLFIWLLAAAGAAWVADRKGYTERVGLTFGLILSFVGLVIVLLLPGRPGSLWKAEGPLPRRRSPRSSDAPSSPPNAPPPPPSDAPSSPPNAPPPPPSAAPSPPSEPPAPA